MSYIKVLRFTLLASAIAHTGCSAKLFEPVTIIKNIDPDIKCNANINEFYPSSDTKVLSHNDYARSYYPIRIEQFKNRPIGCNGIVMLGDSLTEMNNWEQSLTTDIAIYNRGIKGDTTDGILNRLDEIIIRKPKMVFVMIGTNDLWSKNSSQKISQNILTIATTIRLNSPDTRVYVQTVMPLRDNNELNIKVMEINQLLKTLTQKEELDIIDLYSIFVDNTQQLQKQLTYDGVHLSPAGYALWQAALNEVLRRD